MFGSYWVSVRGTQILGNVGTDGTFTSFSVGSDALRNRGTSRLSPHFSSGSGESRFYELMQQHGSKRRLTMNRYTTLLLNCFLLLWFASCAYAQVPGRLPDVPKARPGSTGVGPVNPTPPLGPNGGVVKSSEPGGVDIPRDRTPSSETMSAGSSGPPPPLERFNWIEVNCPKGFRFDICESISDSVNIVRQAKALTDPRV